MAGDREERVRRRAYEIWEKEGGPSGREREHWEQAERELGAGEKPARPRARAAKPAAEKEKSAKPKPSRTRKS